MPETFSCSLCNLCKYQDPVRGYGNKNADIMIISEAPKPNETRYGKPFVDKAGNLIDECFEKSDINRDDIFITTVLLGKPPENSMMHKWAKEALKVCPQKYLEDAIKRVNPKVIILLGNTPLNYFHGIIGIKKVRGKIMHWNGIPTIPALHPSYFLKGKIGAAHQLVSDLRLAKRLSNVEKRVEYKLVDTVEKCYDLLDKINNVNNFAIDTETTGLNTYKAKVFGIPISFDWYTGYYMPIRKKRIIGNGLEWFHEEKEQKWILYYLKHILADKRKAKALHNANYDLRMFNNDLGMKFKGKIVDTMITNHLLNENYPKDLSFLSTAYPDLAGYDDEVERVKSLLNKNKIDLLEIPLESMRIYGAGDAIVTYREAMGSVKKLKEIKI